MRAFWTLVLLALYLFLIFGSKDYFQKGGGGPCHAILFSILFYVFSLKKKPNSRAGGIDHEPLSNYSIKIRGLATNVPMNANGIQKLSFVVAHFPHLDKFEYQ